MESAYKIISPALILLGIAQIALGAWLLNLNINFKKNAVLTTGTVSGMKSKSTKNNDIIYAPVVTFNDENNNTHTFTARHYNKPAKYPIGASVPVVYDKNNPDKAGIDDFQSKFFTPLFFIILGLFFLIMSIYLYVKYSKG